MDNAPTSAARTALFGPASRRRAGARWVVLAAIAFAACDSRSTAGQGGHASAVAAPAAPAANPQPTGIPSGQRGESATTGVTVYHRLDFDDDLGGFRPARKATLERTAEAVSGQALLCRPREKWGGAELPLGISGSRDLKIAFLAKGRDFPTASLNVFDRVADDNTTSYAPRLLSDEWTPILYHLDGFRYNSRRGGTVDAVTEYSSLRFFGPEPTARTRLIVDNLVIYRGQDLQPPAAVSELTARATATGVDLQWSAPKDDVGVMGYAVSRRRQGERDFRKVAETHTPRWRDAEPADGSVEYRVLAFDFERNLGAWSATAAASSVATNGRPEETAAGGTRAADANRLREIQRRGRGRVRRGHVCLFGDSLTRAKIYREKTQAALGIFTVAAHGFPRKRTDYGREKVDEILGLENPEFLLVLFGTNNLRGGEVPSPERLEQWMADLEAIAASAHSRGTLVLFGTVPPRGFAGPESPPEEIYNQAVRELGERLGAPVADIFQEFQAAGDRRLHLTDDGVHWTPGGMELAARAWAKAMREAEWTLRDRPD